MSKQPDNNKILTTVSDRTHVMLTTIAAASQLDRKEVYALALAFAANHDDFISLIEAYKQDDHKTGTIERDLELRMKGGDNQRGNLSIGPDSRLSTDARTG